MNHTSEIESTGTGDDKEYAVSCSCRTHYVGRLSTYSAAASARSDHKAAVSDGSWQRELDIEAARMAALAPLHAAQLEAFDAKEAQQSASFGVIIAKQHGGDFEAASADLVDAKARSVAADASLASFLEIS